MIATSFALSNRICLDPTTGSASTTCPRGSVGVGFQESVCSLTTGQLKTVSLSRGGNGGERRGGELREGEESGRSGQEREGVGRKGEGWAGAEGRGEGRGEHKSAQRSQRFIAYPYVWETCCTHMRLVYSLQLCNCLPQQTDPIYDTPCQKFPLFSSMVRSLGDRL